MPFCRRGDETPAYALSTQVIPRVFVSSIAAGPIGSIQQQLPKYPRKALNVTLILSTSEFPFSFNSYKGRFPPFAAHKNMLNLSHCVFFLFILPSGPTFSRSISNFHIPIHYGGTLRLPTDYWRRNNYKFYTNWLVISPESVEFMGWPVRSNNQQKMKKSIIYTYDVSLARLYASPYERTPS